MTAAMLGPMIDLVLYEPEIPPNTGAAMRLAVNTGARLHLVRPLGFNLSDRELRRAGMDYRESAVLRLHDDWNACRACFAGRRLYAVTTRGTVRYDEARFQENDVLVFGPETRGLPQCVLDEFERERRLRVPMRGGSRSLNLANTVAVVAYEAWRQLGFAGSEQ